MIIKDFKAFTSAFKLLICSSFVPFIIGYLLEMGKTRVVCVCVEAKLRGVVSSLAGAIVLLAERILKCSSITSFSRSSCGVSYTNSLSQLLAVVLLICANKRSIEDFSLLIFLK